MNIRCHEELHSDISKDNRRIGCRCCCRLCLLCASRLFEWFMCHYFEPMEQHAVWRCDGAFNGRMARKEANNKFKYTWVTQQLSMYAPPLNSSAATFKEASTFRYKKYQRVSRRLALCSSRLFYAAQAAIAAGKRLCFCVSMESIAATVVAG